MVLEEQFNKAVSEAPDGAKGSWWTSTQIIQILTLEWVPDAEVVLSAAKVGWLRAVGLQRTSVQIGYGGKSTKYYCIALGAPSWGMGSDDERAKNTEIQPGLEALTREVRANRRQSEGNGEGSVAPRRSNRIRVVVAGNEELRTGVEDINAGEGGGDGGGEGGD